MSKELVVAILGVVAAAIGLLAAFIARIKRHEVRIHAADGQSRTGEQEVVAREVVAAETRPRSRSGNDPSNSLKAEQDETASVLDNRPQRCLFSSSGYAQKGKGIENIPAEVAVHGNASTGSIEVNFLDPWKSQSFTVSFERLRHAELKEEELQSDNGPVMCYHIYSGYEVYRFQFLPKAGGRFREVLKQHLRV